MSCSKPEQKKGVDYIIRATGANHQVRIFAATTRETVEYARQIHHTSPVATAALGRLLTAGAIMGSMQKGEDDLITLQIKCSGPIKGLTVTSDGKPGSKAMRTIRWLCFRRARPESWTWAALWTWVF